jgi:hypothetical protein
MDDKGLAYRQPFVISPQDICAAVNEKAGGFYVFYRIERGITVFIGHVDVSTCNNMDQLKRAVTDFRTFGNKVCQDIQVAVRCGGMPLGNHMNTRPRTRSEAHMGVYVNESGTLGDIAEREYLRN